MTNDYAIVRVAKALKRGPLCRKTLCLALDISPCWASACVKELVGLKYVKYIRRDKIRPKFFALTDKGLKALSTEFRGTKYDVKGQVGIITVARQEDLTDSTNLVEKTDRFKVYQSLFKLIGPRPDDHHTTS